MRIPNKPFAGYKWRWAEVTPSEGLNNPLRLLGVLRAMRRHEGEPKTTENILPDLQRIESDTNRLTGEKVRLARVGERNLFRNSDRYWKALGLMEPDRQEIHLTPFGQNVADGEITQNEFAITVIRTLTLPNPNIEADISEWRHANLRIKPLELILAIIKAMHGAGGEANAYLTPYELQKIIIPLAGDHATMAEYVKALELFRSGDLNVATFPDCAPGSNDRRMVREFLLFLSHYGFCRLLAGQTNDTGRFFITTASIKEIDAISNITGIRSIKNLVQAVRQNSIILEAERRRILTEVISRPQQAKFRREILANFANQCLLTNESTNIVLEACHLIPVKHKGSDNISNGLCLRADIHILFDSKHIRFKPDGEVQYSELLRGSPTYAGLPRRIIFPQFISEEAVRWRYDYY